MRTQSDKIFDGALPLSGVVVKISVHRLDQGFHARLLQPYPKKAGTKMKFLLNRPLKSESRDIVTKMPVIGKLCLNNLTVYFFAQTRQFCRTEALIAQHIHQTEATQIFNDDEHSLNMHHA